MVGLRVSRSFALVFFVFSLVTLAPKRMLSPSASLMDAMEALEFVGLVQDVRACLLEVRRSWSAPSPSCNVHNDAMELAGLGGVTSFFGPRPLAGGPLCFLALLELRACGFRSSLLGFPDAVEGFFERRWRAHLANEMVSFDPKVSTELASESYPDAMFLRPQRERRGGRGVKRMRNACETHAEDASLCGALACARQV